jgi:two-component system, response regulator YesN
MPKKLHMLYVDDEPLMRRAVVRAMKRQPVEMHIAASAEEALEIIGTTVIDLLVTDFLLGALSGIDVATFTKKLQPRAEIVLVSGFYDWAQREAELEAAGIEYFLRKPWEPVQLENIIRDVLKRRLPA